jgi:hypothetical protein
MLPNSVKPCPDRHCTTFHSRPLSKAVHGTASPLVPTKPTHSPNAALVLRLRRMSTPLICAAHPTSAYHPRARGRALASRTEKVLSRQGTAARERTARPSCIPAMSSSTRTCRASRSEQAQFREKGKKLFIIESSVRRVLLHDFEWWMRPTLARDRAPFRNVEK